MLPTPRVQELVPHLRDPERHIEFLSARLGPGHECIDARAPRAALVAVLVAMARHPRCKHLQRPAKLLEDMHACVCVSGGGRGWPWRWLCACVVTVCRACVDAMCVGRRFNEASVDEYDVLRRLDALAVLADQKQVAELYTASQGANSSKRRVGGPPCGRQHHGLLPMVLQVLHAMGDEDLAVRSAAQAAGQGLMEGLVTMLPASCEDLASARRIGAW